MSGKDRVEYRGRKQGWREIDDKIDYGNSSDDETETSISTIREDGEDGDGGACDKRGYFCGASECGSGSTASAEGSSGTSVTLTGTSGAGDSGRGVAPGGSAGAFAAAEPGSVDAGSRDTVELEAPPLVRKKSGQLVKSSLKLAGLSRSASASQLAPSKSVRFATRLANVKMFDGDSTPSSVSTTESTPVGSPSELCDSATPRGYFDFLWEDEEISDITSDTSSDTEEEYGSSGTLTARNVSSYLANETPSQKTLYNIANTNFSSVSHGAYLSAQAPCYVLSVSASAEPNSITGYIMVKNLAYEKKLSIKITFDNWKSHYVYNNVQYHKSFLSLDYDQFKFVIPLTDKPPTVQVQFVVKYDVSGISYWDNNDSKNYRMTLTAKKSKPSRPWSHKSKNSVPQFDLLISKLMSFRPEDQKIMNSDERSYRLSKKFTNSKLKSDFHSRYDINFNLNEPKSNPFLVSMPDLGERNFDTKFSTYNSCLSQGRESVPHSSANSRHPQSTQGNQPGELGQAPASSPGARAPVSREPEPRPISSEIDRPRIHTRSFSTSDVGNQSLPLYNKPTNQKNTPFNSNSYTDFLQNYCFYKSDSSVTNQATALGEAPPSLSSSASTFQHFSDSIYT